MLTLVVMRDRDLAQFLRCAQTVLGSNEELVLFQGYSRKERVSPGHIGGDDRPRRGIYHY